KKDAVMSPCGRYRYRLTRVWDESRPAVCWVMLNPSTADAVKDDPTIRRGSSFSWSWGAGGLVVVNLFAFRATNPADLLDAPDPVGPENDAHVRDAAKGAGLVMAAWGVHGSGLGRNAAV